MLANKYRFIFVLICFSIILLINTSQTGAVEITSDPNLTEPYVLKAEDINYDYQQGIITAQGRVNLIINDLLIKSEMLSLNLKNKIIKASKQVYLKVDNQEVTGDSLKYNYASKEGSVYGASSRIEELNFQGGKIKFLHKENYKLKIDQAALTPCNLVKPHYQVKADQVLIYADGRVVGKQVSFWAKNFKLFSVPAYVLERDEETGKYKNPLPIPSLSYNTKEGFAFRYYYPYQTANWQGKALLEINQRDEHWLNLESAYQLSNRLKLKGELIDQKELDEDSEDDSEKAYNREQVVTTGLEYINQANTINVFGGYSYDYLSQTASIITNLDYLKENYNLQTDLSYNLTTGERKEKFALGIKPEANFKFKFAQEYLNESLVSYQYQLGYQNKKFSGSLTQRAGNEGLDYLPYLNLAYQDYQVAGIKLDTSIGLGRVQDEGIMATKSKIKLALSRNLKPTPGLEIKLKGQLVDNHYFKTSSNPVSDYYQVYSGEIGGVHQADLTTQIKLKSSLGYEFTLTRGEAIIPVDEEENSQYVKPGIDLTYLLPEPDSAWSFGLNGKYELGISKWDEASINVTRKYDCFSLSFDYNLVDDSLSFGFAL